MMCVLIFALAACTATKDSGAEPEKKSSTAKEDGKVLYMNNGAEPTSFDPPIGFDSYSWNMLNNLMEGLTRLGKAMSLKEQWPRNGIFLTIKSLYISFAKRC